MREKRRVAGAAGGALGLGACAAVFGTCCVAPWAVGLFGFAGAAMLARLAFLQPWLIVGSAGLLALAFWWAYRPQPACAAGACEPGTRRSQRWIAWLAGAAVCLLALATCTHLPAP